MQQYIDKTKRKPTVDPTTPAEHLKNFVRFGMRTKVRQALAQEIYNRIGARLWVLMGESPRLELTDPDSRASQQGKWVAFNTNEGPVLPLPYPPVCSTPYQVMRQVVFVQTNDPPPSWDERVMLCVIAGNVRENSRVLRDMQRDLRVLGTPLQAWLLEHNEHLFTCAGNETYEPWLTDELLQNTVEGMWHLSSRMFGCGAVSYETLAAYLREPDVERVKCAVRRIGICSCSTVNDRAEYAVQFTHGSWRWEPGDKGVARVTKQKVSDLVSTLKEPASGVTL